MNVLRSVSVSVEFYSKVATFSLFKVNSFFLEKPCTFLEQPKVWSFWEMLLFRLDSTANLLTPANFYTFKIFVRKPHFFILKKPEVWTFEDCYSFSQFCGKLAAFAILKDFSFSRKIEVFFNTSKSQNLNVLRNLTNSFALYSKFFTISDFWQFQEFFGKPILFCKKPNSWKFWEISLILSHSTSNWLTVSVAVDIKLAELSCFQKFRFLFRKNHLIFQNQNFRTILLIQSTCGKFATFRHLTKQFKIFSRETQLLFKNKTNFERFEKP